MAKHRDLNVDDPIVAEHDAMDEAEATSPHDVDEAQVSDSELLGIEVGTDTGAATPAELAAVHTDTETVRAVEAGEGSDSGTLEPPDRKTVGPPDEKTELKTRPTTLAQPNVKPAARSARYQAAAAKVDRNRAYASAVAFALIKETAAGKTDQAVEVHIRLKAARGKKGESERFRTVVSLPHGTGKETTVGVLDDALIEQIAQAGDTEFDILLATPVLMPRVAKIAKILGPKGKMPNPKTGTVTDDPEAAKAAIASGRLELRADAGGNLHQIIGRVSWPAEQLVENFQALRAVLPAYRLQAIIVCATFGPGIRIEL